MKVINIYKRGYKYLANQALDLFEEIDKATRATATDPAKFCTKSNSYECWAKTGYRD